MKNDFELDKKVSFSATQVYISVCSLVWYGGFAYFEQVFLHCVLFK